MKKSPLPLFAKEGYYSSLWKREVRRDFTKQCSHYFESINKMKKGICSLTFYVERNPCDISAPQFVPSYSLALQALVIGHSFRPEFNNVSKMGSALES
jgi:hypothetical protein